MGGGGVERARTRGARPNSLPLPFRTPAAAAAQASSYIVGLLSDCALFSTYNYLFSPRGYSEVQRLRGAAACEYFYPCCKERH